MREAVLESPRVREHVKNRGGVLTITVKDYVVG
jgi:hypothetical protein